MCIWLDHRLLKHGGWNRNGSVLNRGHWRINGSLRIHRKHFCLDDPSVFTHRTDNLNRRFFHPEGPVHHRASGSESRLGRIERHYWPNLKGRIGIGDIVVGRRSIWWLRNGKNSFRWLSLRRVVCLLNLNGLLDAVIFRVSSGGFYNCGLHFNWNLLGCVYHFFTEIPLAR